jgi:sialate O-acetylesterase
MKTIRLHANISAIALFLLIAGPASADVKLPAIFGNGMVLQREMPVPVWGWDAPGTEVTVAAGDAKASAKADGTGAWSVKLPALKAGGPIEVTVTGTSTVKFADVLMGEVWICSGQSNMEMTVGSSDRAQEEIASARYPKIRHIKINHRPAFEPKTDVPTAGWQVCSPETVGGFTAAGYFMARHLLQSLDVPIGLIGSNWGGTRIEPWTPPEGFKLVPALKDIAGNLGSYPKKNAKGEIDHQSALALYNGMIHPLVPYAIRGAIWYQGESNNGEGMLYLEKMKALIEGWREVFKRPYMPFYYVGLAPFRYGGDPAALAGIWEAQEAALSIPGTGMAVTVDISNLADIHPKNKQEVGRRLALWALARDYGRKDLVFSGPLYRAMTVEGDKARISFYHVGGGLVSRDGKPLSWFTIAGEDGKFVEAKASIDGETVVVSSPAVAKPVAVRFGWHQEAEPNLSNKEGLPAAPFRTDRR